VSGAMWFERVSRIDCTPAELGEWHFRAGAIHRLVPPWESIQVVREASPLVDGAIAEIRIRKGPIATTLVAIHEEVERSRQFVDRQQRGPFGSWRHTHRFDAGDGGAELRDSIAFDPPLGVLGRTLLGGTMQRELARQFAFRHARTRADIRRHSEIAARFGERRLRIGVTGASGFVGRQLCAFLSTGGHDVVRFIRGHPRGPAERRWNPADPERGVDPSAVENLDAVVHLAGAGIAEKRWSPTQKREIRDSRVLGTSAIARAIARASRRPQVLVSASAIGFYGSRGDEPVDERSGAGSGFLPEVVQAWEGATVAARDAGVRVVHARFGVVLSAAGGALAKMLTPFMLGAGGPVGHGRQGVSWISLDDLIAALLFAIRNQALHGPVNFVSPRPVAQRGFARVLGRVLYRPSFAPLPAPLVRLLFGEMGQRLLLDGAFVRPAVLESQGFRFEHDSLERALRLELGRLDAAGVPTPRFHGTILV